MGSLVLNLIVLLQVGGALIQLPTHFTSLTSPHSLHNMSSLTPLMAVQRDIQSFGLLATKVCLAGDGLILVNGSSSRR